MCGYHSVSHPSSNVIVNPQAVESVVLNKSLEHIPRFGFDALCVTHAVRELGYADSLTSALTSSSSGNSLEFQLVLHWLRTQRQKLNDEALDPQSKLHSIADEYDRACYLINKRLEYNQPVNAKLSGALAHLIVPYNVTQSMDELHSLSDDIAYFAGDQSNDFTWYSKRLSLSTLYVSAELFMLQDTSAGFSNTKEFVERKVAEISNLGDAYNSIEQWSVFNAISLVNLIKSQLLRG